MRLPQYLADMGDEGVEATGDELVPVVVAVRMKPNTENAPIAFHADPTNNTLTALQPNHVDCQAEFEGESHLRQEVRDMFRFCNFYTTTVIMLYKGWLIFKTSYIPYFS